jgi:PAS domain S-box-containing protein
VLPYDKREISKMNDDKNQIKEQLTERFKQLFEGMSSGVAVYEAVDGGNDFIIKDFNRAAEEIDDVKREDIIGRRVTEVFPGVEEFGLLEVLRQVWKTGSSRNYPITFYKDEKITGWRENYIYKLPSGKVVAIYDDITERKRAEERIEHLNLVLRAVRNVNQLITQEKDPARLLQGSCEILTSTRGYLNVWIALLDESGKLLRYAESKVGEDFAAVIKRLERGELTECAKKALSSSEVQMIGKPLVDCGDCPLADTYSGRSALVKRLEHEGKVYGILAASIPQELASDEEEQDIFSEVADDITFALHNFEVEEEHKQAEEELKAANSS